MIATNSIATKNEKRKTGNAKWGRAGAVAILHFAVFVFSCSLQWPSSALPEDAVSPQAEAAVDRAVKYLADKQTKDGTWETHLGASTAVTWLASMAFMA